MLNRAWKCSKQCHLAAPDQTPEGLHMYTGQSVHVHSTRRDKMMHISNQDNAGWAAAAEAGMILTKQVALQYIDDNRPTNYRE